MDNLKERRIPSQSTGRSFGWAFSGMAGMDGPTFSWMALSIPLTTQAHDRSHRRRSRYALHQVRKACRTNRLPSGCRRSNPLETKSNSSVRTFAKTVGCTDQYQSLRHSLNATGSVDLKEKWICHLPLVVVAVAVARTILKSTLNSLKEFKRLSFQIINRRV